MTELRVTEIVWYFPKMPCSGKRSDNSLSQPDLTAGGDDSALLAWTTQAYLGSPSELWEDCDFWASSGPGRLLCKPKLWVQCSSLCYVLDALWGSWEHLLLTSEGFSQVEQTCKLIISSNTNSLNLLPPTLFPHHFHSSSLRKLCPFESRSFHLCCGHSLHQCQICFVWSTHFMFKICKVNAFRWSRLPSVLIPTYCITLFFCVIFWRHLAFEIPRPVHIDLKVKTNSTLLFYWVNYWHMWEATSWEAGASVLRDYLNKWPVMVSYTLCPSWIGQVLCSWKNGTLPMTIVEE